MENFYVARFLHAGMVRETTLANDGFERISRRFWPDPGSSSMDMTHSVLYVSYPLKKASDRAEMSGDPLKSVIA